MIAATVSEKFGSSSWRIETLTATVTASPSAIRRPMSSIARSRTKSPISGTSPVSSAIEMNLPGEM